MRRDQDVERFLQIPTDGVRASNEQPPKTSRYTREPPKVAGPLCATSTERRFRRGQWPTRCLPLQIYRQTSTLDKFFIGFISLIIRTWTIMYYSCH